MPASAHVAFPFGTWAERDGLLMNVDGIVQAIERNQGVGPSNLTPPVEVLEELLGEVAADYEWRGREGLLAALVAHPAFAGIAIPVAVAGTVEVGA